MTFGPVELPPFGAAVWAGLLVLLGASAAAQAGAPPMCALDMGSNTFRRIVGSFAAGRYAQQPIEQRTLGVGDEVARHGRIGAGKLAEIEAVLASFRRACRRDGAAPIVAVGTAAFRDAADGAAAVAIAAKLGIVMEIASEARESELAYLVGSLGRDDHAVIDHGSRSIELVARERGALRHHVFNLGYRVAFDQFFAPADDPAAAVRGFQAALLEQARGAAFMQGRRTLVGVEFGEMMAGLFEPAPLEGREVALVELQRKVEEIVRMGPVRFAVFKQTPDADRALPRLVAAATLTEAFGYTRMVLTERELGAGLIIEAGLRAGGVQR